MAMASRALQEVAGHFVGNHRRARCPFPITRTAGKQDEKFAASRPQTTCSRFTSEKYLLLNLAPLLILHVVSRLYSG